MSVVPERRIRALALLASLALGAGIARSAARLWPAGPEVAWIDRPGVPVELADDGVILLRPPATVGALLREARHACARALGEPERRLAPGDRVTVSAPGCRVAVGRMSGAARLTLRVPLDVNLDDAEALAALPAVGPGLARAIVRDRARRGPFRSVDDLVRVPGVGPATLRAIRRHVVSPVPEGSVGEGHDDAQRHEHL